MHGSGPEHVLLVMGLSTPCSAWDHQTKYLAESGDYTVIVFDNRGMGFSDAPIGLYSTSQMAVDALELLDHFQWKSNVHLVGISMGGMISLEMADAEPTRFQSLTLTSPTARRNLLTQKPLVQTEYETNRELAIHGYIGHTRRSRRQPLHGNLGQTAACLRHYVSDERLINIKSSGLPIMIVTGTFDNLVRPEYSYHMKKILQDAARFELGSFQYV
ncbi:hypothetical protein G6F42_009195 [Rhizopus arrhizus]|nr:hypothetical protein G6F42_009195 [Rhizopus arrhizus]